MNGSRSMAATAAFRRIAFGLPHRPTPITIATGSSFGTRKETIARFRSDQHPPLAATGQRCDGQCQQAPARNATAQE